MKFGQYLLIASFFAVIFGVSAWTILSPEREISTFENRKLAQEPVKDLNLIRTGEYFKQYETYFTDQILLRDFWVEKYTQLQIKLPKTYIKGYYIAEDGFIGTEPNYWFPEKELKKSAVSLNKLGSKLSEKGTKLYYYPVPSKANMTSPSLPSYIPSGKGEENKQYLLSLLNKDNVQTLDLRPTYEKFDYETIKDFYFKTDHHWNIKGAFLSYKSIMEDIANDLEGVPTDYELSDYVYECLEGYPFSGSYNKQLLHQVSLNVDTLCYYHPTNYNYEDYIVYRGNVNEANLVPYHNILAEEIQKKTGTIEYGSGYTWDLGEFNIVNPKSENDLNVLIVKDSYANAIIFNLAHHFKNTTVVDVRYNTEKTVYDYVGNNEYDLVVLFYNDSNLVGEMYQFDKLAGSN